MGVPEFTVLGEYFPPALNNKTHIQMNKITGFIFSYFFSTKQHTKTECIFPENYMSTVVANNLIKSYAIERSSQYKKQYDIQTFYLLMEETDSY